MRSAARALPQAGDNTTTEWCWSLPPRDVPPLLSLLPLFLSISSQDVATMVCVDLELALASKEEGDESQLVAVCMLDARKHRGCLIDWIGKKKGDW